MTPTEIALNNYIEKHIDEIPNMTISSLANKTHVSTATIERTVKKKAIKVIPILSTVLHQKLQTKMIALLLTIKTRLN